MTIALILLRFRKISSALCGVYFITCSIACTAEKKGESLIFYIPANTLQCQERPDISKVANKLASSGIAALNLACGSDGQIYPSQCGQPDGLVYIVTIHAEQRSVVETLGFKPAKKNIIPAANCK